MDAHEFQVLGPFEVRRGGRVVDAGGGRRRALLAVLLLSANREVTAGRLIEAVWGQEPPDSAANLVQGYVSKWRTVLEPHRAPRESGERLASTASGYILSVATDECDMLMFESLRRDGIRAIDDGDLLTGRRLLRDALAQRRGPALQEFRETLKVEAAALERAWLDTEDRAADVELRLGHPEEAMRHLADAGGREPLRESTAALRVLALYRAGRQAEALAVVEATRSALVEALGVDLGSDLAALHLRVLRQDPSLKGPEPVSAVRSLPRPRSSFLGRERELSAVTGLLRRHRLVTLIGAGGSGKTRLAIEAATAEAARGDRDVTFVDLSSLRDAELIWQAVATATGRQPAANLEGPAGFALQLAGRPTLLVLDNVEWLTAAGPEIARALSLAPALVLMATSREPLGLEGEQLYAVQPLPVPEEGDDDRLILRTAAVRLFVDRARAADPSFEVSAGDAPVVAAICRRLDGLPLALELAAPWTSTLSLSVLLRRLERPWALLDHDARASEHPSRHRTLRAAIEWSYAGLTRAQRELLDILSVFASSAQLESVEAVAGSHLDTVPTLAALVERNLVQRIHDDPEPRYRLLETVRHYAYDQLAARPAELLAARSRHVDYFAKMVEQAARGARTPAGEGYVAQLGRDHHEIRAALDHLQGGGDAQRTLEMVTDCLPLWWDIGHTTEGYRRLSHALSSSEASTSFEVLAAGHAAAASLGESIGAPEAAAQHARAARSFALRAGSAPLEALALCLEGNAVAWTDWNGPATEGVIMLERARELGRELPDDGLRWSWTSRKSVVYAATLSLVDVLRHRDPHRARDLLSPAWDDDAHAIDSNLASFLHRAAGFLDADAGNWARAEAALGRSLALAQSLGSRRSEARSMEELGLLAWRSGDLDQAQHLAQHATRLSRDSGHTINWVRCAAQQVDVALEQGDLEGARALLVQAEAAAGTGYPALAQRMLAPRQVRLARMDGDAGSVARHLARIPETGEGMGLPPARVVHLIELAHAAARQGDRRLVVRHTDQLLHAAQRIGLTLPAPEQRRVKELRSQQGQPSDPRGVTTAGSGTV